MAEEKKKGFNIADIIGSVSDLNTGAEGREQLKYIDFERIHPDPGNFYSLDGLEELAGNIELIGLQQPLRVRPDPEHKDEYIIVSGHRRRAAIELLVKEGKDAFRLVPCLIEGHQESDAMRELRLILANSSTRKLTSADLATQAKKVEELLYKLKEEGTEFPGRMRDHVAEVCQVKASKLGKLKVIREKLIGNLQKDWERGNLRESVAYAFAKQKPEVQVAAVQHMLGHYGPNMDYWREVPVNYAMEIIKKELRPKKGPEGSCDRCDRTQYRLMRLASKDGIYSDHCKDGKCCHGCPSLGTCSSACPHLAGEVEKAQKVAREKGAKENARKAKENEAVCAPKIRLWKRFGEARARAGLTFEEYAQKADVRAFRREKKIADFEQGKKITPSSGGLPYTGGDGVDEWRIKPLIKAADALGCSVDYLLCRTDEPGMAKAAPEEVSPDAKPKWQTGQPFRSGQYYCLLECEGQRMSMRLRWFNSYLEWHMPGGGELTKGCEVVGWWPLPEDDPEDTEEEPEEDNEDDMDALWYGHEDDDDYVAEAGDVLGADE